MGTVALIILDGLFNSLILMVMVAGPLAVVSVPSLLLARLAARECRSLLDVWTEENEMTLLRCRGPLMGLWGHADLPFCVVFWVEVVDRGRKFRSGWALVSGRFWAWEYVAWSVEFRWVRERDLPRRVMPPVLPVKDALWDPWIDG